MVRDQSNSARTAFAALSDLCRRIYHRPLFGIRATSTLSTPVKPLPTRLLGLVLLAVTIGIFIAAANTGNVSEYLGYVKRTNSSER